MSGVKYLETVRRELQRLRRLAEDALAQVDDEGFFQAHTPEENSLAILVKHMAGNMRSRWSDFLDSDGEKPDRHRDSEFVITGGDTRAVLMERWNFSWATLSAALDPLAPDDLERTVRIRGEPHTVVEAIQRQLSHYAYHVGQIVQLARHLAGDEWVSLSIPRGGSTEFNRDPESYLPG